MSDCLQMSKRGPQITPQLITGYLKYMGEEVHALTQDMGNAWPNQTYKQMLDLLI